VVAARLKMLMIGCDGAVSAEACSGCMRRQKKANRRSYRYEHAHLYRWTARRDTFLAAAHGALFDTPASRSLSLSELRYALDVATVISLTGGDLVSWACVMAASTRVVAYLTA
jgi:hypothetical protein